MSAIKYIFADALIKANEVNLKGTQVTSADGALTSIINTVYFVAGIVAVVGIVIGGWLYVTSNECYTKVRRSR